MLLLDALALREKVERQQHGAQKNDLIEELRLLVLPLRRRLVDP